MAVEIHEAPETDEDAASTQTQGLLNNGPTPSFGFASEMPSMDFGLDDASLEKEGDNTGGPCRQAAKKVKRRNKQRVKVKVAKLTSDESTALSAETSDLAVPKVVYVFHKVPPPKKRNALQRITNSMRIRLGLSKRRVLDADNPEASNVTLVDL